MEKIYESYIGYFDGDVKHTCPVLKYGITHYYDMEKIIGDDGQKQEVEYAQLLNDKNKKIFVWRHIINKEETPWLLAHWKEIKKSDQIHFLDLYPKQLFKAVTKYKEQ